METSMTPFEKVVTDTAHRKKAKAKRGEAVARRQHRSVRTP